MRTCAYLPSPDRDLMLKPVCLCVCVVVQVILNCSALQSLLQLLNSPKESIKKEACWTISNITAGNRAQIQMVIDAGLLPPLITILQVAEFRTRKEAAWAITNATSGGSAEQIRWDPPKKKKECGWIRCHIDFVNKYASCAYSTPPLSGTWWSSAV